MTKAKSKKPDPFADMKPPGQPVKPRPSPLPNPAKPKASEESGDGFKTSDRRGLKNL